MLRLFKIYFILLGILISVISTIINISYSLSRTRSFLESSYKSDIEFKKNVIKDYITQYHRVLNSILISDTVNEFIENKDNEREVIDLFYSLTNTLEDIMQLRYIDEKGKEVVRVDRINKSIKVIGKKELQDKSNRYYFIESFGLPANRFWYSNVDLNIERGKIEVPYKPTFRISINIYDNDNKSRGIIIVNLLFKNLIEKIISSSVFNIYIIDKNGEFICHTDNSKSWSKYLNLEWNLINEFPETYQKILSNLGEHDKSLFIHDISNVINNNEGLKLIYTPKKNIIDSIKKESMKSSLTIGALVIILCIPIAWGISYLPIRLQKKLDRAYLDIRRKNDIIDKYVMISKTDKNGYIEEASSYFTKVTGYKLQEVIGKKHSFLSHPDTLNSVHKEIIDKLNKGEVWEGELKDLNKAGEDIWVHLIISPEKDDKGNNEAYIGIFEDITDKKKIEKMSITDPLTGLNNRRRFDALLDYEVSRCKRYNSTFSLIMLDIDYFKKINDTYGHHTGDIVLVHLSTILSQNARLTDHLCRWGGEEFIIILSDTDSAGALLFAEKLRKVIENYNFPTASKVTISLGVTQYAKKETQESICSRVDNALYKAKKNGRNRTIQL